MWMKHMKEHKCGHNMSRMMSEPEAINKSSSLYLLGALISILISFVYQVTGKKETSLFVGQWPTTLLILGMYDRMYKMMKLFKRF
jgi:hypothetical protein